ncbi:MAG TPA: hypothetical protein VHJ20_18235 [Polyangia bacterium]|nr:hypothetical protein [Polyangia bacterium]
MLRPRFAVLAFAFASLAAVGCKQGNGERCEIPSDCASGICGDSTTGGVTSGPGKICQATLGTGSAPQSDASVTNDASSSDASDASKTDASDASSSDAGDASKTDASAPETGAEAGGDAGTDASPEVGGDAGTDASVEVGGDAGIDASASDASSNG